MNHPPAEEGKSLGLYFHIPFCPVKCHYCDFISFENHRIEVQKSYLEALRAEIQNFRIPFGYWVDSIFFGGGTPFHLDATLLRELVRSIQEAFPRSPDCEWTIEANPETVNTEKLAICRDHGVNRLSLGCQSFDDAELKLLGRIHDAAKIETAYAAITRAGFINRNLDMIAGWNGQSPADLQKSLTLLKQYNPEHVSLYLLTIEPATDFQKKISAGVLSPPSDEIQGELYDVGRRSLSQGGYHHYEISNFAKLGYECRHNLKYWDNRPVIGFGVGAWSYFEGVRERNTPEFRDYLSAPGRKTERLALDPIDQARETLVLRLRTRAGASLSEIEKRFDVDLSRELEETLRRHRENGMLILEGDRLAIPTEKWVISNEILADLI